MELQKILPPVDFSERSTLAAVADARADLLVVGRSAPNGLIGRLRTNAYALIRESPCPVISV